MTSCPFDLRSMSVDELVETQDKVFTSNEAERVHASHVAQLGFKMLSAHHISNVHAGERITVAVADELTRRRRSIRS